jgi:hypothetical protein
LVGMTCCMDSIPSSFMRRLVCSARTRALTHGRMRARL